MSRGNGTGQHPLQIETPTDPAAERFAKWITSWQVIAGVVASLVLGGGVAALGYAGLAKKEDVAAAIAGHEKQGEQLVRQVADHEQRIRANEHQIDEEIAASHADREWMVRVLDEQRQRQRLDVPPPPARKPR